MYIALLHLEFISRDNACYSVLKAWYGRQNGEKLWQDRDRVRNEHCAGSKRISNLLRCDTHAITYEFKSCFLFAYFIVGQISPL